MKFSVLAIVVFAAVAQAKIDWSKVNPKHFAAQPRISGGQEAVPNSIPYQVGFLTNKSVFCSGSIISENLILTSAVCLRGASVIQVIAGAHKIQEEESTQQVVNTVRFVIHPEFDPFSMRNDIALIQLRTPIHIDGKTTQIVKLNDEDSSVAGEEALVSGWGQLDDSSDPIGTVLHSVTENIISNSKCKENWSVVTDNQLCLDGTNGKGPCIGDDGSPLVITRNNEAVQVGVMSYGGGCGSSGLPTVHTNVFKYLDWIHEYMV